MDDLSRNRAYPLPDPRRSAAVDVDRNRTAIEKIDADMAAALAPASAEVLGRVILGTVQHIRAGDTGRVPTTREVKDYVSERITALIDGSPAALDTLVELSKALNDDPNFAATIAAQIGVKADKATVDTAIAAINASLAQYYTKVETDGLLAGKSDKADTYTKTQANSAFVKAGYGIALNERVSAHNFDMLNHDNGGDYWRLCFWDGRVRIRDSANRDLISFGSDGNVFGAVWNGGALSSHVESRCDAYREDLRNWVRTYAVQSVRLAGWWDLGIPGDGNWTGEVNGGVICRINRFSVAVRMLQYCVNGGWYNSWYG